MYRLQSRPLWQRNGGGPSVVIDFVTGQVIPAGWTFSRASAATYYTASGLLVTAAQNVPRFDHDPTTGETLGLLLESMKTNALAASTGMSIMTRCTLTQDAGEGADGTLTTTRITEDTTATSTHYASEPFAISANVTGTYSAFYRPGSRTQCCLYVDTAQWSSSNYAEAVFDLPSCAPVSSYACTNGIRRINNGLLRAWITATSSNSAGSARALGMAAANGQFSFNGAYGTIETWGWQVEANSHYPSSYIPTSGGTATRQADYLTTSDLSFLDPANGTLVFDGAFFGVLDGGMFAFSLDDGVNNGIGFYKVNGSGALTAYSGSSGGTNLGLAVTDGQRFRGGIAWSGAGAAASACVNGLKPVSVAGAQPVAAKELCLAGARTHQFASNVLVRSLTYWPRRLSDAELQAATVLT